MKDERLEAYRKLYDGLSDMVESRRVTREDIPEDYEWLIRAMLDVVALDPETPTPFPCCPKCLDVIAPDESSVERAGREYHAECDA